MESSNPKEFRFTTTNDPKVQRVLQQKGMLIWGVVSFYEDRRK